MSWEVLESELILELHKKEDSRGLTVKIFNVEDCENICIREATWGKNKTAQSEIYLKFEDLEYIYKRAKEFLGR